MIRNKATGRKMLEQEQHPINAVQHSLLSTGTNHNIDTVPPPHTNPSVDPLLSLERMIRSSFNDLSCTSTISGNGSPILTIWQQPKTQSSKGIVMKDLPLFYNIKGISMNSKHMAFIF